MCSDELVVLMTIEATKESTKKPKSRPEDISSSHIGYLCYSLVRRGYLTANGSGGCWITSEGRGVILREALRLVSSADGASTRDRMKRLERLYSKISRNRDNFEKATMNDFY